MTPALALAPKFCLATAPVAPAKKYSLFLPISSEPMPDYSKWDQIVDSDDETAGIPDDPVIQAAAALQETQGGLTAAEQQEVWRQMPAEMRAVVEACNKALAAGPDARVGVAELAIALEAACMPGWQPWFPTPFARLKELLRQDGLDECWSRVFSVAAATSDWVPAGAAAAGAEISVGVRRCTDFLSQPLTAFYALGLADGLGGTSLLAPTRPYTSGRPLVVHVPGALNAFPGNESLGGDEKWRLLQALLPGNSPVTVVYIGPPLPSHLSLHTAAGAAPRQPARNGRLHRA